MWGSCRGHLAPGLVKAQASLGEFPQVKGMFIGCVDNTPCEDHLFDYELGAYGPYQNEHDLNKGIITALKRTQEGPWVDLVLQHDPSSLVKDVKVVVILEWEVSGYYPAYWEYVKALQRPDWESQWSKDKAVERILKSFLKDWSIMWNTRDIMS